MQDGYFYLVMRDWTRAMEKQLISQALEQNHWNRKRAAKSLGMSYRMILYKIAELELRETM